MENNDDLLLIVALLGSAAVGTMAGIEFARGGMRSGALAGATSACASALVLVVPSSLGYRFWVSLIAIGLAVFARRRSSLTSRSDERHKRVAAATGVLVVHEVVFNVVVFFAVQFPQMLRLMGH